MKLFITSLLLIVTLSAYAKDTSVCDSRNSTCTYTRDMVIQNMGDTQPKGTKTWVVFDNRLNQFPSSNATGIIPVGGYWSGEANITVEGQESPTMVSNLPYEIYEQYETSTVIYKCAPGPGSGVNIVPYVSGQTNLQIINHNPGTYSTCTCEQGPMC